MKKTVSVENVRNSPERIDILIVAWGTQLIEGKDQEVALGEESLSFPGGTKPADMISAIRESEGRIRERAAQAKEIREELNRELQEEVPE